MAITQQLTPDLDTLLMELRQAYVGPSAQQRQPATTQMQPQQQSLQPQPNLQMRTPEIPQAAPLQPMRSMQSPMTASLSGLRPDFQVSGPELGAQGQYMPNSYAAQNPQNQLLAQRLQQFMGQGSGQNAQFANAVDRQQANQDAQAKSNAPSGWQSALNGLGTVGGAALVNYAGTNAGAAGISSALSGLGGLAAANPVGATVIGLGVLGGLGYKAYQHYNSEPQTQTA
jgi:hypothetical protein